MIGNAAWVTQSARTDWSLFEPGLSLADFLDRAEKTIAGIVDHDVKPAEARMRLAIAASTLLCW